LKLRRACEEDLPLIYSLLIGEHLPHEDIPQKLECMFIASDGGEVIGIGGVEVHGSHALLRSLVVRKKLRGRGYGRAICVELERHAALKGAEELYLLTTTAEGFFRKLGFDVIPRDGVPEVIRRTEEFSTLCPSSAVLMMKTLPKKL
jgi:amino-acid N-acetyltransferase